MSERAQKANMSLLSAKRDPGWIGCIDFGTALSKFVMVRAVDRSELLPDHIRPLTIAVRPGFRPLNPYLLPSVIFVSDSHVLFGQAAEEAALRVESSGRQAFVSPKQYLSTHDFEDLDAQLPAEIDPTGRFTARSLLKLFLAHLLERAGNAAKESSLPWPIGLRIARPAWDEERAKSGEAILKELVRDGFALVDKLGAKFSAPEGVTHKSALSALNNKLPPLSAAEERTLFRLSAQGRASVLEATAVASGTIRDTGRRVVAVADIGGGTCDFGAFMTGLPNRYVIGEIKGSSRILREAGDYLDMQLRRFILSALGLLSDDPAARGAANRLRARARMNKQLLFTHGRLTVEVGDELFEITLAEFLNDEHIKGFAKRLRDRFHDTLCLAVECARHYPQPNGSQTRVEIMLTGGGHTLPMVRDLYNNPSVSWAYAEPAPDLVESDDNDFRVVRRQLAVAIGGAIRDLPSQTAPVRLHH